ncbi:YpmS family protein [Streptococcus marmotae]|uniref:YpmS family protein n=1 Tax=Streptococcus marmotae TaxID=1825069 RepID=UPI0008339BC2|nr:YpmS family protein [Streptococcus marmotae]
MRQKNTGKINKWKWAFLLLVSALLALGIVVVERTTTNREATSHLATPITSKQDQKIGTFTTDKEQLNTVLATYLKDYQTDTFSYTVTATSQFLLFEGTYKVWGLTIPLYIYFQPNKLNDGSILLTVSEISAGTLSLPKEEILAYLKNQSQLPEFVEIDSKKATVIIHLAEIENDQKLYVKANTIDFYNNQLIFDIYRKS